MPETNENVETMEQVEVQDNTIGTAIIHVLVAGIAVAATTATVRLVKRGIDKYKKQKLTVIEGGKNQDNSESDTDVKDEAK